MSDEVEKIVEALALAAGQKESRYPWPVSVNMIAMDATIPWHPDNQYVKMMTPDLRNAFDVTEAMWAPDRMGAVKMVKRYRQAPWQSVNLHYV